jgi:hypothetical protein
MTASERLIFPEDALAHQNGTIGRTRPTSNAYGRQSPDRPFDTILTAPRIEDAKTGRCVHWRDPRPLTLMEARRAQGFPDDKVVLGLLAVKWRIVGNSVARQVAFSLGLAIREAWFDDMADQVDKESVKSAQTSLASGDTRLVNKAKKKRPNKASITETKRHRFPSIELGTDARVMVCEEEEEEEEVEEELSTTTTTWRKRRYVHNSVAESLEAKKVMKLRQVTLQYERELVEDMKSRVGPK